VRLPRPTIRLKLTLWYGGMFLLAGALLLTLTYVLVRQGFQPAPQKVREVVAQKLNIPLSQLEPGSQGHFEFPQPGMGPLRDVTVGRLIHEIQAEQMQQQLNDLITWSGVALAIMAVAAAAAG
jgi:hypothetical protein